MKINLLRQLYKVMKYSFMIIIIQTVSLNLLLADITNAQKAKSIRDVTISLEFYQDKLSNVLRDIESKTNYKFAFNGKDIKKVKIVNIDQSKTTVYEILYDIAKQTKLDFKQVNWAINISHSKFSNVNVVTVNSSMENVDISGKITDENGNGLPGASVVEKGTANGTITDRDGNYKLSISEGATLLVSFVGYLTQEVGVGGRSIIDIQMVPDLSHLEEVVVIGYGTQKKQDVTGSISSISSANIEHRSVASVEDALQGAAPGLNIGVRDASPGQLSRVTIRAIGSLSAGYEPLWVVDGIPTDQRNVQSISPTDIESVEILKDASSTAIYGSRGANGVIIITTKSGKEGKSTFNVSVKSGVSSVPQSARLDVLNAEEYVQIQTEINGGTIPDFITDFWDGQTDTDWQDAILKTGAFQDYSISASGGADKVSYLLSGSYIDQSGVIPGEGFDKYSARLKLEYRPNDKITFGLNVAPNYSIITGSSRGNNVSAIAQAVSMAPIIPLTRADGSFSLGADLPTFTTIGNPLETVQFYGETENIFRFLGGLSLAIEPLEGLILKSTISANLGSNDREILYNASKDGLSREGYGSLSELDLRNEQQVSWLNENTVSYRRQIGQNHSLDVLGGFTLQKDQSEFLTSRVQSLQVEGPTILSIGNSATLTSSNGLTKSTLASLLGRVNYSFMNKYLLTATVRRDGSSRFGANNRNQTFGSFALGWRLSEESFIQNLGFVDDAKLRASYGSTGSNAIPDFVAKSSLDPVNQAFGGNQVTGVSITSPGNASLTWETSKQLDIGLDLSLFKGRVNVVLDYYNNETTSLLLSRNLVPSSGYTGFLTNIGSMRNKGIEFSLNVQVIDQEDFDWSVGGNVTNNDQEILDLGGDEEIRNFFGALRRTVGGELQNIHVTKAIGIYREGQTLGEGQATASTTPQPGAVIYEDVDGDGIISNFLGADGQNLEGINIDWTFGINTRLRYKNFDFSALLAGQAGASLLDLGLIQVTHPGRNINLPAEVWYDGRYISESQPGDGVTPAPALYNDGISSVSSLGNQKTDYLRLKNITLGYNLPNSILDKIGLSNARVYTSIENVHTWTSFVGGNPDFRRVSGGGPSLFGGSRIPGVSDGLELGLVTGTPLPIPRTWVFGINFNF